MIQYFDSYESQCISECIELKKDVKLPLSLAFMNANFSVIPLAIEKLETNALSLKPAFELMQNVKEKIELMHDKSYVAKLTKILDKTQDLPCFRKYLLCYSELRRKVKQISSNRCHLQT